MSTVQTDYGGWEGRCGSSRLDGIPMVSLSTMSMMCGWWWKEGGREGRPWCGPMEGGLYDNHVFYSLLKYNILAEPLRLCSVPSVSLYSGPSRQNDGRTTTTYVVTL